MNLNDKLIRFLFIGSTDAFYKAKQKPLALDEVQAKLEFLKLAIPDNAAGTSSSTSREDPTLWQLTTIKKVLLSKQLINNREAMLVLAFCLAFNENEKLRSAIYQAIPDIIISASDLFLMIKYLKDFREGKGFGYGMRNAISKWYNKKTAVELAEMIGKNRQHSNFTHADILKLCHVKFTGDPDKIAVCKAAFRRGYQVIKKQDAELQANVEASHNMPGYQILCNISRFKVCENPKHAADRVSLHNLSVEHVPAQLIKSAIVWEALLPKLTYQQLLKYLPFLNDCKMLNPTQKNFSSKFCKAIGITTSIIEAKIHPIELLVVLKQYTTQHRFCEFKKDANHQKKINNQKKKIVKNEFLVKKLETALTQSMSHFQKTGLKYYITIDLRVKSIKKPIFGLSMLTVLELSVLMALSLLKREKQVIIMTFTDTALELKPVELNREMTFEQALNHCIGIAQTQRRNTQRLEAPLKCAQDNKQKYDVFLTFVDSIPRCVRNTTPPVVHFRDYKRAMNSNKAKYVVFGLSRHQKDLFIVPSEDSKGMLEVAGFQVNTPKIVDAFLKNQFY